MSDVAGALEGLRRKFIARCVEDLAALRAWSAMGAPADEAAHRLVHRLAGAAGTFGFHELSAVAKRVDDQLARGAASASDIQSLIRQLDARSP